MLDKLKDPLIELLFLAIASALILHLCSGAKSFGGLKMLCSLFMLLAVCNTISPLLTAISDLTFDNKNDAENIENDIYDKALISRSADYISQYTKELICSRFGISDEDISVGVTLIEDSDGNVAIRHVTVNLMSTVDCSAGEISELVNATLYCECTVLTNNT